MTKSDAIDTIDTIYGCFTRPSKRRLDLTFDYEDAAISSLKRLSGKIGVTRFFDIGANIGVYSVYLSDLRTVRNIHAFEPSADSFEMLCSNIEQQNTHVRFHLQNVALSAKKGALQFNQFGDLAGDNAVAETSFSGKEPLRVTNVRAAPLDNVVKNRGEVFAMKIDVEGHELEVIQGAKDYLTKNNGLLQVESFGEKINMVRDLLKSLGYHSVFQMMDDHYFTNLQSSKEAMLRIFFEENARALRETKALKRMRRQVIRAQNEALRISKYDPDPIFDTR